MNKGPEVLWQTRSTERKTGTQVCGGNVQLVIGAKDLHQFVRVDIKPLRCASDLVGKRDFQSVKCVFCILGHLCKLQGNTKAFPRKPRSQGLSSVAACLIELSDNGLGRG